MDSYEQNLQEEKKYFDKTIGLIRDEIDQEIQTLSNRREELLESRKEMWDNTVHFSNDFEKLTEISQYLSVLNTQTASYGSTLDQIKRYEKMRLSPYFGRFDFIEDGCKDKEKIYVGLHHVIDSQSYEVIVYDWRSPISSIFYEYELGEAVYRAPKGSITGDVLLKRQFKIKNGELKYFFDSSIKIDDEILQQVLCRHSSPKMRNIVETIQKDQNAIIRDIDNELLLVQGVAGSGKTSIALHRIAFLLYRGMNSKLTSNNILIISPNEVFSKYILGVLPELGEENVEQMTFEDLSVKFFGDRFKIEKRNEQLEFLIKCENQTIWYKRKGSIEFKGSRVFAQILNRLIKYYERNTLEFEDIYYDGKIVETKQLLKNQLLSDKIGTPLAKRLKRIESILLDRIHVLQNNRIQKIEKIIEKMDDHELEVKSFSRLLSIKESSALVKRIRKSTEVDILEVYRMLFNDEELFYRLAKGLPMPEDIQKIIEVTKGNLEKDDIQYEDCAAMLFLKLKIEGNDMFTQIRQVVIDEAQDYSPMQYEIFNLLFNEAHFTVLGDIHQSIDKNVNMSLYDTIDKILNKERSTQVFLNKSYRSSYEISIFSQKILNCQQDCMNFQRHETKPIIAYKDNIKSMDDAIIENILAFIEEGHETIAVICKSIEQSKKLHHCLKQSIDIKLIDSKAEEIKAGVMIVPAYMAKGLEFDVVIVYNVSSENYSNELDRKLLYIACTRALHRLVLYYIGNKSSLIPG